MRLLSALQGLGLAYMAEDLALAHIAEGKLARVLEDWYPLFPGYQLSYPSRRHVSSAFAVLVGALRFGTRGDYRPPSLVQSS